MFHLMKYFLVIGLCAWAFGCKDESRVRPGEAEAAEALEEAKESARDTDKIAEEELRAPNHVEAREWCDPKHQDHMGFEMSKSAMLELANEIYAAGAPKVYVTGIEEMGQMKVSATMVVELPQEPQARRNVFAWEAKFSRDMDEEPTPDVGQKYFFIALD